MVLDLPRQRLESLIEERGTDYKAVSKLINRNDAFIHKFIQYGTPRTLKEADRMKLAELFGVEEWEFMPEDDPRRPSREKNVTDAIESPSSNVRPLIAREGRPHLTSAIVLEADVRLSGGHGRAAEENRGNQIVAEWQIPKAVLQAQTNTPAARLRMVTVVGDSMAPDFRPGQRVMVDLEDKFPSPPGVFAINDGFNDLVIKRVELVPYSNPPRVVLISANPSYERREFDFDEITINGRVIGLWQWT